MARIQCRNSKNGKKRYYVTIRMKGQQTISGVFDRKTEATTWAAKTESDIRLGRFLPKPSSGRHTVADLIDKYIQEVLPQKSPTTQYTDRIRLEFWKEHLGHVTMKHLTSDTIQEAVPEITARGNGPASLRRYLAILSAAVQAARKWRWIDKNPVREVPKPQEPKGRLRYLTQEEWAKLLDAVRHSQSPMLAPAVYLSLCTGMRRGELLSLTWDRVDLDRGHISLLNTKNKTDRGVPLTKDAVEVLREYGKIRRLDSPLVFPSLNGKKGIVLRRSFRTALRVAGITDFRWHDLRHTCASYLAMSGESLAVIAEILGHKTLQMTMRYAHLSAEAKKASLEKMSATFLAGK